MCRPGLLTFCHEQKDLRAPKGRAMSKLWTGIGKEGLQVNGLIEKHSTAILGW